MTVGSKTTDLTTLAISKDISYPYGGGPPIETNIHTVPIGFMWTKTWSGLDYGSEPTVGVFQRYWKLVDTASSSPGSRPRKTYLQVWEERRDRKRVSQVEHPYTCTITFWSDALFQTRTKDSYPPFPVIARRIAAFRETYGSPAFSGPNDPWNSNDTIALQGKLRERIVGSDFDVSVFLGEGREALNMITGSATRIYKAYKFLRKGRLHDAARALGVRPERSLGKNPHKGLSQSEVLAQRWLELQYGWLPLVQDAYGAAQALAQQLNEPAVQTYRVRRRKEHSISPIVNHISNGGDWGVSLVTRAQLIAKLEEVDVVSLNGLSDPSSVLWELTPWSFVADWFIPIGNYLAARGLAQAVTGTFVTTLTTRQYFYCYALKISNPFVAVEIQPLNRYGRITVDRTVSTSLQTPKPQFKTLDEVFSWKRCANAVALLVTGFSGIGSKRGAG